MYVVKLRVEKALEEEKSRVSNYLNTESEARMLQVLDKELLEHKETVRLLIYMPTYFEHLLVMLCMYVCTCRSCWRRKAAG